MNKSKQRKKEKWNTWKCWLKMEIYTEDVMSWCGVIKQRVLILACPFSLVRRDDSLFTYWYGLWKTFVENRKRGMARSLVDWRLAVYKLINVAFQFFMETLGWTELPIGVWSIDVILVEANNRKGTWIWLMMNLCCWSFSWYEMSIYIGWLKKNQSMIDYRYLVTMLMDFAFFLLKRFTTFSC